MRIHLFTCDGTTATMATFCTWKDSQPSDKYVDIKPSKKTASSETTPDPSPEPEATTPPAPETTEPSPEASADPITTTHEPEVPSAESPVAEEAPTDNPELQSQLSALGIEDSGLQEDDTTLDMDMLGVTLPPATGVEENAEGGEESNIDLAALRDAGIDLDF